jgi:hypothetical protein
MELELRKKMLNALDKEELIDLVIELQDSKEIRYIPYPCTIPQPYPNLEPYCTSANTELKGK